MKSVDRGGVRPWVVVSWATLCVPLVRVGFFLLAVSLAASLLLLRSVHADMTEALAGIGAEVLRYPGAHDERVRRLQLNGVQLSFRTQTVDAPFDGVLEHYRALCATRAAHLDERLTTLLDRHYRAPSRAGAIRSIATQSERDDNAGYVACLDMGQDAQDFMALADRFRSFLDSGELRDLGELRYVFARRVNGSSEEKTFLLTMWADSGVLLHRMLPGETADAAGRDPDGVPRPPGSQRIVSADESGQPSSVFVYRVAAKSPAELESFYRRELPIAGWSIVERDRNESTVIDGIHVLFAEKDHQLVTVLSYAEASSRSVLTILASEPS